MFLLLSLYEELHATTYSNDSILVNDSDDDFQQAIANSLEDGEANSIDNSNNHEM